MTAISKQPLQPFFVFNDLFSGELLTISNNSCKSESNKIFLPMNILKQLLNNTEINRSAKTKTYDMTLEQCTNKKNDNISFMLRINHKHKVTGDTNIVSMISDTQFHTFINAIKRIVNC